ncbi:hypothetical protein MVEN_00623600 [Mycena venus]|uniref:Uncharacterized protein n=1 Tax=Mycena venus TaxID=2733690 RepID=A0A8H7D7X6_9AGAR|nr:hypothetical protein MVEN_00623600 [Mycena venus]
MSTLRSRVTTGKSTGATALTAMSSAKVITAATLGLPGRVTNRESLEGSADRPSSSQMTEKVVTPTAFADAVAARACIVGMYNQILRLEQSRSFVRQEVYATETR